jgi:Acyl-CoA carboxylase epsilon subunit
VAIQILTADATPEEIAAIVVALTALASATATAPPAARRTSNWAAPVRGLRAPHRPGHDQWRATNLPG